jgi:hypothetical protein
MRAKNESPSGPNSSSFDLSSYNSQMSDFINGKSVDMISIQTVNEANADEEHAAEIHKTDTGAATDVLIQSNRGEDNTDGHAKIQGTDQEPTDTPNGIHSAKRGLPAYLELLKVEDITADTEVLEKDLDAIEHIECEPAIVSEGVAAVEATVNDSESMDQIHCESAVTSDSVPLDGAVPVEDHLETEQEPDVMIDESLTDEVNETLSSHDDSSFSDSSQDEVIFHYYGNNKRTLDTCVEEEEEEEVELEGTDVIGEAAVILASMAGKADRDLCKITDQSTLQSIELDSIEYSFDSVVTNHPQNQGTDLKIQNANDEDAGKETCLVKHSRLHQEASMEAACGTPRKELVVNISDVSDSECPTPESPKEHSLEAECQTPSRPSSLTGNIALCSGVQSVGFYESPNIRFGSTSSEDALCTNKFRSSQSGGETSCAEISDMSSDCVIVSPVNNTAAFRKMQTVVLSSDSDSDCEMFEENTLDVHESLYSTVSCPHASGEMSNTANFASMSNAGFASVPVKTEPVVEEESTNDKQIEKDMASSSDSDFEIVCENKTSKSPVEVKSEPVYDSFSGSDDLFENSDQIVAELAEAAEDTSFHQPPPDGAAVQAAVESDFEILNVPQTCANFSALSIKQTTDVVPAIQTLVNAETIVIKTEPHMSSDFEVVYSNWTPINVTESTDLPGDDQNEVTSGKAAKSDSPDNIELTAGLSPPVHFAVMNCQVYSGPKSWKDLPHDIKSISSCESGSKWMDLGPTSLKPCINVDNDQENIADDLSISNDSAVQSLECISDDVIPWNGVKSAKCTSSSFSESSQEDSGEHEEEPLHISSPNLDVFAETLASLHPSQAFPSLGTLPSSTSGSPNGWFFPPPSLTSMVMTDLSSPPPLDRKGHRQPVMEETCSGFFYVAKRDQHASPLFIKQEPESESSPEQTDSSSENMQYFPHSPTTRRSAPYQNNDLPFITSVEDDYSQGHCIKQEDNHFKLEDTQMRPIPVAPVAAKSTPIPTAAKSSDEKHVFTSEIDGEFNTTMDIDEVEACEPEGYLSLVSRAEILGATDREFDTVSASEKCKYVLLGQF